MKRVAFAVMMAVFMLFPLPARAATSLEALLQEAKLTATKVEGGMYRVYVELDGEATPLLLEEEQIGTSNYKMINFWATVISPAKGFVPPAAMLKKIVELNDVLQGGAVTIEGNVVLYKTSMLLNTGTTEELRLRMILAHVHRKDVKKALQPFVEE